MGNPAPISYETCTSEIIPQLSGQPRRSHELPAQRRSPNSLPTRNQQIENTRREIQIILRTRHAAILNSHGHRDGAIGGRDGDGAAAEAVLVGVAVGGVYGRELVSH